jgi:small nuclear ribonucleoprotein
MSENEGKRPLDLLEKSVGEMVTVRLKSGERYVGELNGYDQHLNLVVTGDGPNLDGGVMNEIGTESVEGTLIIRGDNVVSIAILS